MNDLVVVGVDLANHAVLLLAAERGQDAGGGALAARLSRDAAQTRTGEASEQRGAARPERQRQERCDKPRSVVRQRPASRVQGRA